MSRAFCAAGLWLLVAGASGCAVRHDYMPNDQKPAAAQAGTRNETEGTGSQQAALKQVGEVTGFAGDRSQVRNLARQTAMVLKGLLGLVSQAPNANQQVVAGLTRDVAQLTSGLDAIADSANDQEFSAAVFEMCQPETTSASARVGPLLIGLAARIEASPPKNVPEDKVSALAHYFDSMGETFVRIPAQCRLASAAKEQNQAKGQSEEPTDAAEKQPEHRRQANLMMLCIAANMGAPSPNKYPMGTMARLGYAMGQCR